MTANINLKFKLSAKRTPLKFTLFTASQWQAVLLLRWAVACTERDHSPSAGGFRESTHFVR